METVIPRACIQDPPIGAEREAPDGLAPLGGVTANCYADLA